MALRRCCGTSRKPVIMIMRITLHTLKLLRKEPSGSVQFQITKPLSSFFLLSQAARYNKSWTTVNITARQNYSIRVMQVTLTWAGDKSYTYSRFCLRHLVTDTNTHLSSISTNFYAHSWTPLRMKGVWLYFRIFKCALVFFAIQFCIACLQLNLSMDKVLLISSEL